MQGVELVVSVGCTLLVAREKASFSRPFGRVTVGTIVESRHSLHDKGNTNIHDPREHVICVAVDIALDFEDVFGGDRHRFIRIFVTFESEGVGLGGSGWKSKERVLSTHLPHHVLFDKCLARRRWNRSMPWQARDFAERVDDVAVTLFRIFHNTYDYQDVRQDRETTDPAGHKRKIP